MSRKLFLSLFIVLILVCLFLTGNITHIFSFYRVKDYSLLPGIGKGSIHIASNLKKYSYNDIVYCTSPVSANHQELLFRKIAGLEGDTIEFNDGYLLRNGLIADNPEQVMFNYFVKADNVKDFSHFKMLKQAPKIKGDSIILCMNYSEFKELSRYFVLRKVVKEQTQKDPDIFGSTNENLWDNHNYGPVVVPKGHCFVLTDNRDNFADSRHFGFVSIKNIKGVVIW